MAVLAVDFDIFRFLVAVEFWYKLVLVRILWPFFDGDYCKLLVFLLRLPAGLPSSGQCVMQQLFVLALEVAVVISKDQENIVALPDQILTELFIRV